MPIVFLLADRVEAGEVFGQTQIESIEVSNVVELSDVRSTDWAFLALQSLSERYQLEVNFGENKLLTRYEFAAVLSRAIASINGQKISQQDWQTLERLQKDFAKELKLFSPKLEPLSETEQKFSPTTKLEGEVVFALSAVATGDKANDEGKIDSNLTFGSRVRLNFDTSFFGKDRLRTRLQANSIARIDRATGTDMARLSFQGDNGNSLELSRLEYILPVSKQATLYLEGLGGSLNDFTDALNPYFTGSSKGSVSRFGQRNPIYRHGEGSGIGINYAIADRVSLAVGFVADEVNDPEIGFNKAAYGAIAQLTLQPTDSISLGLTYVRSYNNLDTGTGSQIANDPFNEESSSIVANSFGFQSSVEISRDLTLGGWLGVTRASALDLDNNPSASVFNWAVTVAFPDLGKEGNLAGIVIGQPPKAIDNDFQLAEREFIDRDTSLHLETFYRFEAVDNVAVTLGLMAITNPEHDSDNDAIYLGTIRTTFSF
jgi:hypothetical protein